MYNYNFYIYINIWKFTSGISSLVFHYFTLGRSALSLRNFQDLHPLSPRRIRPAYFGVSGLMILIRGIVFFSSPICVLSARIFPVNIEIEI